MLRELGHESDIFALTIDDNMRGEARPFSDPAATRADVTIFHFALPSPMTGAFAALDGAKVLQYHNITPAAFFADYDPALFRLAALGRRELAMLAGRVDLALGDSDFNRRELQALGFERTDVMLIGNTARITDARGGGLNASSPTASWTLRRPNRPQQEDRITSVSRRCTRQRTHYRFIFVGRSTAPRYDARFALVDEYGCCPTVSGSRTGARRGSGRLTAGPTIAYRSASTKGSRPAVEAMAADVPIVAYGAGAVPRHPGRAA